MVAEYDPPQPLWKRNLAGILDFALAMIVFGIPSTKIFGPNKPLIPVSQNPNTSAVGAGRLGVGRDAASHGRLLCCAGADRGNRLPTLIQDETTGRRPPRHF